MSYVYKNVKPIKRRKMKYFPGNSKSEKIIRFPIAPISNPSRDELLCL